MGSLQLHLRSRRQPFRMILVGTGGHGQYWCERILRPLAISGRIEVVAAVDIVPAALDHARRHLGVPSERCFADARAAFAAIPAEFCVIVVPPESHEELVDVALAHGLDILCEKPLAHTLDSSVRIATAVQGAGARMGVTMSHRYELDKATLRAELKSGRHGPADYLHYRFTCNFRRYPRCGVTRHFMAHPLMLDAAVHHLDIVADLVGAPCEAVYAQTWNPPWGEFNGPSQALVTMKFENGTRAFYEGAYANATGVNAWADDYVRVECELATLVLNHRRLEVLRHRPDEGRRELREGAGSEIPLLAGVSVGHTKLIEQFLAWVDGDAPMDTSVDRNLESAAILFAAIESGSSGRPVNVARLLADAHHRVAIAAPEPAPKAAEGFA